MVKEMCMNAGISGNKTNHSLRSFGVTEMFTSKLPEKVIQERSGHRSLDALRVYEKTDDRQLIDVSRVLSCSNQPNLIECSQSTNNSVVVTQATQSSEQHIFHGCTFTNCNFTFQK